MANFSFKREVEVFLVHGGNRYKLDISDISFDQTFKETSFPVKTLHNQAAVFESSAITTANPANFSFSIPALVENDFTIVETLLLNANQFDLFVKNNADTYKLTGCVITNGSFEIEKTRPLRIGISGQAQQLQRGQTLTGSLQSRSANRTYIIPSKLIVTIDGTSVSYVTSLSLELQNDIKWTPYATVHGARSANTASTSMYPSSFSLSKKILSGSITEYLTNVNASENQTWSKNARIQIKAGNGLSSGSFRGFHFGPATCSFTNRTRTADIFTQSYDWRMIENPTLSTVLKYETD